MRNVEEPPSPLTRIVEEAAEDALESGAQQFEIFVEYRLDRSMKSRPEFWEDRIREVAERFGFAPRLVEDGYQKELCEQGKAPAYDPNDLSARVFVFCCVKEE